jgi:copper chaperone CopZ
MLMYRIACLLVLILWLGACQARPTAPGDAADITALADVDPDARIPGASVLVYATGLSCPLCAHNIDLSMKRVPGVAEARVNLETGAVAVTLDGTTPVTYGQLAKVVRDNGFTLTGFGTPQDQGDQP